MGGSLEKTTQKIRVAILYGGRSNEHEISLLSAKNVIQNLDRSLFDVIPIGIDKQGSWFLGDEGLQLLGDQERLLFNPEGLGKALQPQQIKPSLINSLNGRIMDVIFPVIHGPLCEDGTMQGLLELADVPYVGCGVLSSAIGMDKDVSKRLIEHAGILVPKFLTTKVGHWKNDPDYFCAQVFQQLPFPIFVKPANTGSSVGVHKVHDRDQFVAAVNDAFRFDTKVIVEQGISGRELEVAVLEALEPGADPIASVVGEIRPAKVHGFYSYASKYLDENGAELVFPVPLADEVQEKIRRCARHIFTALECEGMARVDLFLEHDSGHIYFNEVNTIPGFTKISMYPQLMNASGMAYSKLLTHLIMLAMKRHEQKCQLNREYVPG